MTDIQPIDLTTPSLLSPRRAAATFLIQKTACLLGFSRRLTTFEDATKREHDASTRGKSVDCVPSPFRGAGG